MASFCLYVKSRLLQDEGKTSGVWKFYYIGSLITAIMAMFTKEIAFTLPLAVLLYEFCFLKKKGGISWKLLTPFFFTLLIIPLTMVFTKTLVTRLEIIKTPNISADEYLLTQFRVLITYIRLLFLPINQNLDYDYPIAQSFTDLPTLISFLALVFILIMAIRISFRYRLISFGISWFFLTLMPESSILPIKDVIFEHRLYLPMVGFSLFLVSSLYYLIGQKALKPMIIMFIVISTCYSVLTYKRNIVWQDDFTLWNDVVQKSLQKPRPYQNRGAVYQSKGNLDQAILDYNKAIQINPNFALAYNNRGLLYQDKGNFKQALSDFNKAIHLDPNYAEAYNNLALAYFRKKEFKKAWENIHKAEELGFKVAPGFIEALKKASEK